MDFHGLQENLRQLLARRIRAGELSGLQLARQAGFQQPHICNFLNYKRSLSLEALDRVLTAQRLSIVDLLDERDLARRASLLPPARDQFENVILVDAGLDLLRPRFIRDQVRDIFKIGKSFLHSLRPAMEGDRSSWQRFIFLRAGARDGLSMYPRLLPGACVLIDRHYNSTLPYRRGERNIYSIVDNGTCFLRYLELSASHLILRAENPTYPPHTVPLVDGTSPSDHIVGRICRIQIDT
jgi:hypothetical protein